MCCTVSRHVWCWTDTVWHLVINYSQADLVLLVLLVLLLSSPTCKIWLIKPDLDWDLVGAAMWGEESGAVSFYTAGHCRGHHGQNCSVWLDNFGLSFLNFDDVSRSMSSLQCELWREQGTLPWPECSSWLTGSPLSLHYIIVIKFLCW